jgi:hypothetical protein
VARFRTELQFLCDVPTAFVVAAMREDLARFFQNEIHIRYGSIIEFRQVCHGATFPSA